MMNIRKYYIKFISLFIFNKKNKENYLKKRLISGKEKIKNNFNLFVLNSFQDILYFKYATINRDLKEIFRKNNVFKEMQKSQFSNNNLFCYKNMSLKWGLAPKNTDIILNSQNKNDDILFVEDGFLRSGTTFAQQKIDKKYKQGISFIIDDLTCYYDCTRPSRLEMVLNSDFKLKDEEIIRAKNIIEKILNTNITKYNHQPIYTPSIGRKDVKKVLVVDQSYGDFSILKGGANDETFKIMLETAIKENPDADIIIKTHPDAICGKKKISYYSDVKIGENIFKITEPINPLSLIKYVDKVYVCSTQLGFEALMAGKGVHTFGIPFYSNYGLTIDYQKCTRRTKKRSLEELFFVSYIMFSIYYNPNTGEEIEIEEAIDLLLDIRKDYFKEFNVRNDG